MEDLKDYSFRESLWGGRGSWRIKTCFPQAKTKICLMGTNLVMYKGRKKLYQFLPGKADHW